MPVFEFNVTSGSQGGGISISQVSGTLTGTIGGENFTFSFQSTGGRGTLTDILLGGTYITVGFSTVFLFPTGTSRRPTTTNTFTQNVQGTFAFTDPNAFFSDFQLSGSGAGFANLMVTTAGGQQTAALGANFSGNVIGFTVSGTGGRQNVLDAITSNAIQCFCAGTRIATPDGFTAVEDLAEGDVICRAECGTTTVRWLGRQTVAPRFADPARVAPVRIAAGALGQGLPTRDLRVSPDHGIALDGVLVNASALVNGTTIWREAVGLETFTYYHVETDAHELILAEGVAAESYLDRPSRAQFDNGAERAGAPTLPEMTLPRVSSRRLLPAKMIAVLGPARKGQAA